MVGLVPVLLHQGLDCLLSFVETQVNVVRLLQLLIAYHSCYVLDFQHL